MNVFKLNKTSQLPPPARQTLALQLILNATTAPYMAMMQYALFVVVKTFHASDWCVAALYVMSNICHLLAIGISARVQRGDPIAWVVWPNLAAFAMMLPLARVRPEMVTFFVLILIASQLLRTPIYLAQAILYRTHFPPNVRSWAMAVNLAVYMACFALFSWVGGPLLEQQRFEPLEIVVAGDKEDHHVVVAQPLAPAEVAAHGRRIGQRRNRLQPVVDHRDSLARHAVILDKMVGRHATRRDHMRRPAAVEGLVVDQAEHPVLGIQQLAQLPEGSHGQRAQAAMATLQRRRTRPAQR